MKTTNIIVENENVGKRIDSLIPILDKDLTRNTVQRLIEEENIKVNGAMENRLPGNANISFKGINGNDLVLELDNYGICTSSGSACSSGSSTPSHVLTSIGLESDWAYGALRVSLSEFNTIEEIDYLINCLINVVNKLRKSAD